MSRTSLRRALPALGLAAAILAGTAAAAAAAAAAPAAAAPKLAPAATVAAPTNTTPGSFAVSYIPGKDSAKVRWTKSRGATNYTVTYAEDRGMKMNAKTYSGLTSTSLNIPLNSRDGSHRYVKVTAHNGTASLSSERTLIRAAATPSTRGEILTIATQNVLCGWCDLPTTVGVGRPTDWDARWPIIVKAAQDQSPDIIALQEASPRPRGTGTFLDPFMDAMGKAGYTYDRAQGKYQDGSANRIWFKASKFERVDNGVFLIASQNGRRGAAWVKLRSKATGKELFAVSFHADSQSPLTGAGSRTLDVQLIDERMAQINTSNLPIFIAGDAGAEPNISPTTGPFRELINRGYTDLQSAPRRTGGLYGTYNGLRDVNIQHDGRLDYLFSKNTGGPLSYENVMRTNSKNEVLSPYGSDHNMVIATTRLR